MNSPDPDLKRFRPWCRENGIGISTAYRLVKDGKLRLTHVGKSTYLTRAERQRFLESLEQAA